MGRSRHSRRPDIEFLANQYPYALAAIFVGLGLAVRLAFDPWLGNHSPYTLFLVAVAITALFTNVRAALTAAIMAALVTNYFFVPPRHRLGFSSIGDVVAFLIYAAAALAIALLAKTRLAALRRAESDRIAAEELRNHLRAVVDAAPAAIITFGIDRTVTGWNRAAERIFGWRAEEIIGKMLPVPDSARGDWGSWRAAISSGQSIENVETRRIRKDGAEIDVLLSDSPIFDGSGQVVGFIGVIVDASELVSAKRDLQSAVRALTESDARTTAQKEALEMAVSGASLDAVLGCIARKARELTGEGARTAIYLVDADGKHLRFAASAEMDEGYTRAVDGFTIDPTQPACGSVAHTGQPSIVKDVRSDSLWAPYLSLANQYGVRACWSFPIRSNREQPLGTIAIYHSEVREPDSAVLESMSLLTRTAAVVIEMKAAEAASKASEQQFIQLAESIPQLAWMADAKGWIFWYNRRWYEYTGTTLKQMQGWGWRAVHHPDHVERVVSRIQRSWDTGEPWEDTFPLCGTDGRYRWFLSRALPIRDERGVIVRWFGTNTDITELREAEEALRRAEAVAATGRMAHAMAHEINNPLEAVTNILYLLGRDPSLVSGANRELIASASAELARICHITKQTLSLYGTSKRAAPTDLCALLEEVMDTFSQRIAGKKISVQRRYTWSGTIEVLQNELREAVWNLVDNAIDAAEPGGRISVRVRSAHQRNGKLREGIRLTIADNGRGMSEAFRKKLFEPFSTTKGLKGMGLGLWVVRDIVSRHGGEIRIRTSTRPGSSGTCCTIFLPLQSTKSKAQYVASNSQLSQPAA